VIVVLSSSFNNQELAYKLGIGKHSAIALSKAGWNVVLIARREQELQETAAQCPNPVLVQAGDITDEPFVKQAFEVTKSHFGRYHQTLRTILVYHASGESILQLMIVCQIRSIGPAI
jgi:NAD(P)-dependent dehydrogenase (short-subunit alcohol dehydrogenase family)